MARDRWHWSLSKALRVLSGSTTITAAPSEEGALVLATDELQLWIWGAPSPAKPVKGPMSMWRDLAELGVAWPSFERLQETSLSLWPKPAERVAVVAREVFRNLSKWPGIKNCALREYGGIYLDKETELMITTDGYGLIASAGAAITEPLLIENGIVHAASRGGLWGEVRRSPTHVALIGRDARLVARHHNCSEYLDWQRAVGRNTVCARLACLPSEDLKRALREVASRMIKFRVRGDALVIVGRDKECVLPVPAPVAVPQGSYNAAYLSELLACFPPREKDVYLTLHQELLRVTMGGSEGWIKSTIVPSAYSTRSI